MFYVTYNNQTGNLVDISDKAPSAQENYLTILTFPSEKPDLYFYTWDSSKLDFVPKNNSDRDITVLEYLNRFTAQERIIIKTAAKTDAALSDYLDMLNVANNVNLSDPLIAAGLAYLNYLGLLDQSRIQQILA